jgi:HK97 family phage major capsid protein
VPTYNSLITRADADALIPTEQAAEVVKALTAASAVLSLCKTTTMSSKVTQQPVLSALPVAYWVNGDTGLKQTTEAAWSGIDLVAEEIAVMVPCGEAVLDDADYDIWDELREPIAEAFAVKLDAAILAGVEKPASWPAAIIPGAIAAGNTNTIDSTPEQGGLYTDLVETFDDVEDDGYQVSGIVAKRALRSGLRKARDTTGQKLVDTSTGMVEGVPISYALPGTMTATEHAVTGDWDLCMVGIRQDLTYKVLDQAVITDDAGVVVFNAAQQDAQILRVVARYAYAVGVPAALREASAGAAFPFGVLQGTLPARTATRSKAKASS